MGWFQKLIYGIDLEEEQRRGDELDRQLREMNERDYGPGGRIYERIEAERGTEEADAVYDQVRDNLNEGLTGDVEAQVDDAFREGLEEGYENVTGGISNTLAAPFRFTFASIPWQLWIAAAVALFLYMGGGVWLKGLINRKFQ